jgi:hypothetical protein
VKWVEKRKRKRKSTFREREGVEKRQEPKAGKQGTVQLGGP